jgi:putative salt-induced outer membrane protein
MDSTISRRAQCGRAVAAAAAFALAFAPALGAQELCPCPPPPPPPPLWTGSLGLSYLATTGNSSTESAGFTTAWLRQPTPWGLEVHAAGNRAKAEGALTAERYYAAARGRRALGEQLEAFAGLSAELNELAGFDSRTVVEAGALWKAIVGPVHELAFDAGLTWTSEDPVAGPRDDFAGALAGLAYTWRIGEAATFSERLVAYPSFADSDDWRLRSETALETALVASWALRVAYQLTRDNQPPPGFEKTDSATSLSLVWRRE